VTRIVRTFRIQRIIRLVAPLRTLVFSIAVTLKSLLWAMILLFMIIFVVGIVCTQAATDSLVLEAETPTLGAEIVQELNDYWSPLDQAMYTLFQTISGGVSWRDPAMSLEMVSPVMRPIFTLFISFVYFAVLNVVTGVFCSCAIETTSRNPEVIASAMIKNKQTYIENLKNVFYSMDEDGSGLITLTEFENILKDEMMNAHLAALEIDCSDAWTLFKLIDSDKSGVIEIDEFVHGCEQLKGSAKGVDVANMTAEFRNLAKKIVKFMKNTEEHLQVINEMGPALKSNMKPTVSVGSIGSNPTRQVSQVSVAAGRAASERPLTVE